MTGGGVSSKDTHMDPSSLRTAFCHIYVSDFLLAPLQDGGWSDFANLGA